MPRLDSRSIADQSCQRHRNWWSWWPATKPRDAGLQTYFDRAGSPDLPTRWPVRV